MNQFVLLLSTLTAVSAASKSGYLGPGSGPWTVDTPESHNFSAAAMERLGDHIFKVGLRGCAVVVHKGSIVFERYIDKSYNTSVHEGYSQTKTLGALVAGWAYDEAYLDLDADITASYGVASPRSYSVTSRQIMSQAIAGEDGPGELWEYDATGTRWINHMPHVILNATGRKASDIFRNEFQIPLGLSGGFKWDIADSVFAAGSVGTCRDYARFGQLLLNRGEWAGEAKPLVSAKYVDMMRTPQTRYAPYENYSNPCYGLLTWLNTNPGSDRGSAKYPGVCKMWPQKTWFPAGSGDNVYLMAGLFGQETMVIPNHDMVVVSMGFSVDDYPLERAMYEGVCELFPSDCP
eukprot:g1025.t1